MVIDSLRSVAPSVVLYLWRIESLLRISLSLIALSDVPCCAIVEQGTPHVHYPERNLPWDISLFACPEKSKM